MLCNDDLYNKIINFFALPEYVVQDFNRNSPNVKIDVDMIYRLAKQGKFVIHTEFGAHGFHNRVSMASVLPAIAGIDDEHFWAVYMVLASYKDSPIKVIAGNMVRMSDFPYIDCTTLLTHHGIFDKLMPAWAEGFIPHDYSFNIETGGMTCGEYLQRLAASSPWNCFCVFAMLHDIVIDTEESAWYQMRLEDYNFAKHDHE